MGSARRSTEQLPLIPVLERLAALTEPVWGIDPASTRIAVTGIHGGPAQVMWTHTLSLHQGGPHRGARLSRARDSLTSWLQARADEHGPPGYVALEEPFGAFNPRTKARSVPVVGLEIQGMILCALWDVFGLRCTVDLVSPTAWKMGAMGKGNGHAKPPVYLAWAQRELGYSGVLEDEAASIGVAVHKALEVIG